MNRRDFLHSATQHPVVGTVGSRLLVPPRLMSPADLVGRRARLARHSPIVRKRLGLARHPAWDRVLRALSPLPMRDGLYVNAESAPQTFTAKEQRSDHSALLGAYGFIASPRVDRAAMRRTLRRVMTDWQWSDTWGWDYPLVAMTAARVGDPEIAVDALMMDAR